VSTWPYTPDTAPGPLAESDLDAAVWRKRAVIQTREQRAAVDETAGLCGHCGDECKTPQACHRPESSRPRHDWPVRVWNAARLLVLRPRLALLRWQLECVQDERLRYEGLGWASPAFTRNCLQQEADLMRRISRLES
jgi:hypothetical protein